MAGEPQRPYRVVLEQRSTVLLRFAAAIGWMGLLVCVAILLMMQVRLNQYFDLSGGIEERFHSLNEHARDKVAVIQVAGLMMDEDRYVKAQIERVRKDDRVKAIVVRVNSPGGAVSGADYIYHHLSELKKQKKVPVVVSMGALAASGGYYVSMVVGDTPDAIFAEPTTTTGSIGVIMPHFDISGLLERWDIRDDSVVSHPRKQLMSMTRPIADEEREILQRYVDQAFERFLEVVKAGRPGFRKDEAALRELATGEIFTAPQAQQYGLVDRIGFVEDAIARACELAGVDPQSVRAVRYQRPPTLADLAGLGNLQTESAAQAALLELTVPRAYYVATTLPGVVSSRRP